MLDINKNVNNPKKNQKYEEFKLSCSRIKTKDKSAENRHKELILSKYGRPKSVSQVQLKLKTADQYEITVSLPSKSKKLTFYGLIENF